MKQLTTLIAILIIATINTFAQPDTLRVSTGKVKENWLYLGDRDSSPQPIRRVEMGCDVAVIGGGMSGISAAVAAARQGADVLLIQDRPVLGGNASSEIRMTVNGAPFERETGVVEELLIENLAQNPQHSHYVWDHILYNYVVAHPNITLALNTSARSVEMDGDRIVAVECYQLTSECEVRVEAPIFIDCTGDGFLGAKAGAEYRTGREGKEEFGERFAPDQADGWVMGETIMMMTKEMDYPVPFVAPAYAIPYNGSDDKHRQIRQLKEGYWWIELGSNYDIIADRESNRHHLMARFYGVWDYIKNSGEFPEAENIALDWVGSLPGRRESRRLMGDYILSDVDLLSHKHFDDAVAYGGWSLDEHCEGGILSLHKPASYFHARFKKYYEIPYRSLYSKNIENLFMAGRCASVSHVALSSTRIIGTCSTMGQAVGVAAAICCERGVDPREIYNSHIDELQERLLRQDYFIPNRPAEDPDNLVKKATKVVASSTLSGDVMNLLDGISRPVEGLESHWEAEVSDAQIDITWGESVAVESIEFKFDTNLNQQIMMHKNEDRNAQQIQCVPLELVESLTIEANVGGEWREVAQVDDNIRRYLAVAIEPIECDAMCIKFHSTHGAESVKLFELRCY
ncbi:MAG: FAD-dependent oxidoreductase [Rikenellaceae bacterium]